MPINRHLINDDLRDRLYSWARYYRDRRKLGWCGSAEGKFRRTSEDFAKEGWGEPTPPPFQAPTRHRAILEAIETNAAIVQLSTVQKWAVTYYYCFSYSPRHVVLKAMRKFTGTRLNWEQFIQHVDLAHVRLNYMLIKLPRAA